MGINNAIWSFIKEIDEEKELGDILCVGRLKDYRLYKNNVNFGNYIDDHLKLLRTFKSQTSLDISSYQGAEFIHDLSKELPCNHKKFDTLVDGGTIEHVFDIKRCIYNYISLLKPGGSLIIETPSNNLCGHGFYQFSPEFFFNALSFKGLFNDIKCYFVETNIQAATLENQRIWSIKDPSSISKRIGLLNNFPTNIIAVATRSCIELPKFEYYNLIQSDYKDLHFAKKNNKNNSINSSNLKDFLKRKVINNLPRRIHFKLLNFLTSRSFSLDSNEFFTKYKK